MASTPDPAPRTGADAPDAPDASHLPDAPDVPDASDVPDAPRVPDAPDGVAPRWLEWAQELEAVAQTGIHFAESAFDVERYEKVRGVAAEMLVAGTDEPGDAVIDTLGHDDGYATPKVDVRAVVLDDAGNLLLVRERSDGGWALPGGFADVGDGLRDAVEREVLEESGYAVTATRLLAVFDRRRHPHPPGQFHIWKLFLACTLTGGRPTTSVETSDVGFFPPDELPELSTVRVLPGQIARVLALHGDPQAPTHFD